MIKMSKKKTLKEKSNTNLPTCPQKISKQKSKNIVEKKFSLSKSKLNSLKTSKNFTESKFNSKKNHNSISSKEEIASKFTNKSKLNKMTQKPVYNNTCGNTNNNNKLFSSNLFLTNDTDIPTPDEEKKNLKKNKFNKNSNNQGEILNLPELETIFKKNTFKKTIIIDNEGNNNLHLNIKKGENDYKILLNNNNKSIFSNSSINANTETNSLFTNASKVEASNINNNINNDNNINNYIIKENEIKKNIIDDNIKNEKNEEEKRIKEYTKIFNLLNTNIEQFKKMFNNNSKTNNNSHNNSKTNSNTNSNNNKQSNPKEKKVQKTKNKNFPQKRNKKILIQNKKTLQSKPIKKMGSSVRKLTHNCQDELNNKNTSSNLKKNLSEKNLSSSSKRLKNQNIFTVDVRNDIEKDLNSDSKYVNKESNNAISSFLESSLQDDFYQSLMNKDFPNLKEDDKIMKDDIISVNIDEKGKDENIQDVQNSRIFRGKIESENYLGDNNIINKKYGKNIDKNNCSIF